MNEERAQPQVIFGQPSREFYEGELKWYPVTETKYWQIAMKDIYVNDMPMKFCAEKECKLVVDTGTSILTAPSNYLKELLKYMDLKKCDDLKKLPNLTFKINDDDYTLEPKDYIIKSLHRRYYYSFLQKKEISK